MIYNNINDIGVVFGVVDGADMRVLLSTNTSKSLSPQTASSFHFYLFSAVDTARTILPFLISHYLRARRCSSFSSLY